MRSSARLFACAAALLVLAGCENDSSFVGGGGYVPDQPRDLEARYEWVMEGWSGSRAVGHPSAVLTWLPPRTWNEEAFRVYGKRAGDSRFFLLATVTSCSAELCAYRDLNVSGGTTYEYYVAAVDETSGNETTSEFRRVVRVPSFSRPATPAVDSAVSLDGAAYVRWAPSPQPASIWKYQVWLTRVDGAASLYQAGESDGEGYLDERAQNGHVYGYRVAAVDTLGHVSDMSAEVQALPRPDVTGELVYAFQDVPAESGFRFQAREQDDPVVAGTATSAHWRLEAGAGGWTIVPLNGTRVLQYPGRTTALSCGPGADAGCRAVTRAPAAGYSTTPVAVQPEYSYVFAVTGSDDRPHYGVIRAELLGSDQQGRRLMVFDWAYQTLPDEARLNRR